MKMKISSDSNLLDKSYVSLDILKLILAIIIILRHCGQTYFDSNSLFLKVFTNILSPIGVPTFFTISGFLFWRKERTKVDLKNQIKRILKLYVIWTIIYVPVIIYFHMQPLVFLQNFLFSGSWYHLWYLPALSVALLIVFYLEKKLKINRGGGIADWIKSIPVWFIS